ncbi:MAG: hypothetical protein F6J98_07595 [Moorea sp. SIO4G2]|nr:hypothetical protein [Moorena sp. SIO3I6]NEO60296.1 hypothetical protein [Moorena sp. SIO4G2]NEP27545.1 hypothetical protein [Moorena sp. SIO3I6]
MNPRSFRALPDAKRGLRPTLREQDGEMSIPVLMQSLWQMHPPIEPLRA